LPVSRSREPFSSVAKVKAKGVGIPLRKYEKRGGRKTRGEKIWDPVPRRFDLGWRRGGARVSGRLDGREEEKMWTW